MVDMMERNPEMFRGLLETIAHQEPRISALAQQTLQMLVQLLTQVLNQSVAQNRGLGGGAE